MNKDINVLYLLAGEGSRFKDAGYSVPKPLVSLGEKSMIQSVYENINLKANNIFIVKDEHCHNFGIDDHILSFCPDAIIIKQEGKLDGAAKTALLATSIINNETPLLIVNSDQYIEWDSRQVVSKFMNSGVDGAILTFLNNDKKWSYVNINEHKIVTEVAEKVVISNHATCGIYYWNEGACFIKYANIMIDKDIRVNNEYYVCPVYNQAIKDNQLVIAEDVDVMYGLGTPEDLNYFIENYNIKKDNRYDYMEFSPFVKEDLHEVDPELDY